MPTKLPTTQPGPLPIKTIPYTHLPPRFGGNAGKLPLLHWETIHDLELYVPDWARETRLTELTLQIQETMHPVTLQVYRVTEVPRDELFGEWYDDAPRPTP